jgi:nitrogen fixation NifU-like protein
MCGDEIDLVLDIKYGVIEDARFDGSACSVSIISSDLLLDFIKGKTLEDVKKLSKDELLDLIDLNLTTSRVKCATLSLTALKAAIDNYEKERE